ASNPHAAKQDREERRLNPSSSSPPPASSTGHNCGSPKSCGRIICGVTNVSDSRQPSTPKRAAVMPRTQLQPYSAPSRQTLNHSGEPSVAVTSRRNSQWTGPLLQGTASSSVSGASVSTRRTRRRFPVVIPASKKSTSTASTSGIRKYGPHIVSKEIASRRGAEEEAGRWTQIGPVGPKVMHSANVRRATASVIAPNAVHG